MCLRARSFFFFAASNPAIENGGFLNESKKDIYAIMPPGLSPKTSFFSLPANADFVLDQLRRDGLTFPLIGKPNIGGRGRGVKALKDEADVRAYRIRGGQVEIVAILRDGKRITNPHANSKVRPGDRLLLQGDADEIVELARESDVRR